MRRVVFVGILLASALGLWVIAHVSPEQSYLYPPCPFYFLTHRYCPGCGSTRAVYWLVRLDIPKAAHCNILLLLSLPMIGYALLSEALVTLGRRALPSIVLNRLGGTVLVAAVLAFWLLRNLPFYPFNILAP